jgi:DNA polymerase III epsilon subunit
MDARKIAEANLIFKGRTGSHAYGMATPTSDLDIRGVFAGDPINVMTPFFPVEQVEGPAGEDTVLFELSKYVRLVTDQNPNIVELLWLEPEDCLFSTPAWEYLRSMRRELLTTKVRATYGGYAMQQISRMKSHDKWLNNPQPEQPPRPRDFFGMVHNLSLAPEFNGRVPVDGEWTAVDCGRDLYLLFEGGAGGWHDAAGALRTFTREEARALVDGRAQPVAICKFSRDEYESRKRDWDNYWTWRKNRNKARGALEEKLGFDGKNGAHTLRLLRTGLEILRDGVVRVRRPDAADLLAVRRGERSYESVLAEAQELDAQMAEAERASPLAKRVDQAMVGDIVMRMYEAVWAERRGRAAVAGSGGRRADGAPNVPDLRRRVVVVDVEGSPRHAVEIAAVEIVGGRKTGRTWHAYVNPQEHVSWWATKVHGLTDGFVADKPTFAEVAGQFLAFVADAPMVMHNAPSDLKVLNADFVRAGMDILDARKVYCSERMARQMFHGAKMSLDALCDTFSVDRASRSRGHSASVDALLLTDCLLRMSEMPGYAAIRDGSVRLRVPREGGEGKAKRPSVTVELSDDGATAVFRGEDGREAAAAVPDFPPATHRLCRHESGALLVLRIPPEGGMLPGWKRPDNPLGPAALILHGDGVVAVTYEDGRPVKRESAAAPASAVPRP